MSRTTAARTLAAIAAAAALALSAPAHALDGGTSTTSFTNVGEIGGASGVLIAPNWVLTAAHVASGVSGALGSASFVSGLGSSTADAVYTFSSDVYPGNDIALVHLSSSIAGDTPILYDSYLNGALARNLGTLTIATAQNQSPQGYGTTTAKTVQVSDVDAEGNPLTVNWLITSGGASVQGGDSGSGLFLGAVGDSAGATLLGVASAALTDSNGAASSAFVMLLPYKSWINSTMAASGQQAKWASAVPEPANVLLTALGGLAAAGLARRRMAAARG